MQIKSSPVCPATEKMLLFFALNCHVLFDITHRITHRITHLKSATKYCLSIHQPLFVLYRPIIMSHVGSHHRPLTLFDYHLSFIHHSEKDALPESQSTFLSPVTYTILLTVLTTKKTHLAYINIISLTLHLQHYILNITFSTSISVCT